MLFIKLTLVLLPLVTGRNGWVFAEKEESTKLNNKIKVKTGFVITHSSSEPIIQ